MTDEDTEGSEGAFDAAQAAAEFAAAVAEEPPAKDSNDYTAILEDEVEALGRLLAEKEQALQAAQDKATAATAEVDRVRVRIERDAAGTIERQRRAVLVSFLDIADDLGRAVPKPGADGAASALAQGVQLVLDKLLTVLARHGARRRPSLGLPFDSAHHEAVGTMPATDTTPAGLVADVLSEGYELGEETLRPARVVVAKD